MSTTQSNFTVCVMQSPCSDVRSLTESHRVAVSLLIQDETAIEFDFHLDCGVLIKQIPPTSMGDALYIYLCIFPQYKNVCLHNAEMLKIFSCFHADSSF